MDTQTSQTEQVAALEALIPKLPCIEQGIDLTQPEAALLSLLKRVYLKFCRYIGPQDSYKLSCGTLWLCFREGCKNPELACIQAHNKRLRPPKRKHTHVSIDEEGTEEPADAADEYDETVMEALRSLNEDDAWLLRQKYFVQGSRTKEIAADAGVSDAVIRQRLARARDKFRIAYERLTAHERG